jgi:hypothetical protein
MKKSLLVLLFVYITITSIGQTIPNGDFENWSVISYQNPQSYPVTSNPETYARAGIFNVVQTYDAYHGSYAVKLTTVTSKGMMGYFLNSDPVSNIDPATWTGGMPYTETPAGIQGHYKYNREVGDQATIVVAFRDASGLNIGSYSFNIGGVKEDWTRFYFDIPALSGTPAKVIFAATSSILANGGGLEGSELLLDYVSFTGVSSQPALLNGDFEDWDQIEIVTPVDWFTTSGGNGDNGINRTADGAEGSYALELSTHAGTDNNGNPNAQSGQVTTGYNDNSGNSVGGIPYTGQSGTLAFRYKYAPMESDKAQVNINFKKDGKYFWSTGLELSAIDNYQYMEIPFILGQKPDTMNIQISSSSGSDLSLIGSVLIIDDIHFKASALLTWTGSTDNDWNNTENWTPNTVPTAADNVIIPNVTNKPFIVQNFNPPAFCNNLTIEADATLTINQGNALTVTGNLTNNSGPAGLVVKSFGSIIENNPGVAATVERDFSSGSNWHLFCLPTTNGFVASPLFNDAFVDEYVESSGEWNRLVNANTVNARTGYSVNFPSGIHTLAFTGMLNTGDQTFTGISYTPSAGGYGPGWHLTGNPYPSAVGLEMGPWQSSGIDTYVYVWDGSQYLCGPTQAGYGTLPNNIIPAMQGFFIKANTNGASLTIPQQARTHYNSFYKKTETFENVLTLNMSGNGYKDKAIVAFNPVSTSGFDSNCDAYKLFGIAEAPQLYSIIQDNVLAINSLPAIESNSDVALGFKIGSENTYTLTISGIESFGASTPVILEDLKTNTTQDLRKNPEYSFSAAPGDAEHRFNLHFNNYTGIGENAAITVGIYSCKQMVNIGNPKALKGYIQIYDLTGRLLSSNKLTGNSSDMINMGNYTGSLLVKVITAKGITTGKVIVY